MRIIPIFVRENRTEVVFSLSKCKFNNRKAAATMPKTIKDIQVCTYLIPFIVLKELSAAFRPPLMLHLLFKILARCVLLYLFQR